MAEEVPTQEILFKDYKIESSTSKEEIIPLALAVKTDPDEYFTIEEEISPNFVYQAVNSVRTRVDKTQQVVVEDFKFKVPQGVPKHRTSGKKRKRDELIKKEATALKKQILEIRPAPDVSKKSGEEGGEKVKKQRRLYRNETLHLVCEWDGCGEVCTRSEDFTRHVASLHVCQVEVRTNPPPLPDVFACLWAECGFESPNSGEMVRHVNFHSFHTKLKCHGQNMLTETPSLGACRLDPSKRNILPDLSVPFTCQWEGCEVPDSDWTSAQVFYWHTKRHADELRGQEVWCRWKDCTKAEFSAVSKLGEHLRCHSQERLVGCPTCGGLFANRIKFFDHCQRQQEVGSESKSFSCTTCGKRFALMRLLRDHCRAHVNSYKCPHCDMTCPTPSTLSNHIIYRHTTDKPFSCEFCTYRGKTVADVKSHIRVHYEEVEMTCPQPDCGFTCRAKLTMKKHLASKHQVPGQVEKTEYGCHLCEERFPLGTQLTKHLISVHSFSWPSGHSRFRYTKDNKTGLLRLQTVRVESLDLQQDLGVANIQVE